MDVWLIEHDVVFDERYLPRLFNRFVVGVLFALFTPHGTRGYSYLIPSGLIGLGWGTYYILKFMTWKIDK